MTTQELANMIIIDEDGHPIIIDEDGNEIIINTDNWCKDGMVVNYNNQEIVIGQWLDDDVITDLVGDVMVSLSDKEFSRIEEELADYAGPFQTKIEKVDTSIDKNRQNAMTTEYVNTITGKVFTYLPSPLNRIKEIKEEIASKKQVIACKKLRLLWVEQNLKAIEAAINPTNQH
jgi:hypothetical protein